MPTIPACTVKGCPATTIHHHIKELPEEVCTCDLGNDSQFTTCDAAPRLTRKALLAEVERLTAECNDLHAEIADKADRLAKCEAARVPVVTQKPGLNRLDVYADDLLIGHIHMGTRQFIAVSEFVKAATWWDVKDDAVCKLVAVAREHGAL